MSIHPHGQYPAGIKGNYFAISTSGKKAPYIAVMFETEHGTMTNYMYLSPNALERSKKDLMTCGWDGRDIQQLADEKDLLAGATVWITIKHEMNQDNTKKRAVIAFVNAKEYVASDENATEMPSDLARTLNLTGNPQKQEPVAGKKEDEKDDKKSVDSGYSKDDEIPF